MAKRFYNTQRIEEDWYLNLSCKHRELLRYCESKCDGAGIFSWNAKIASTYLGEVILDSDLSAIPVSKLPNGKYFVNGFCMFQNGVLSKKSPAHNSVFKSIELNETSESVLFCRVFDRLQSSQEEEEREIEEELGEEKEGLKEGNSKLSITVGSQKFTGTLSEWIMLNKESAIEVLMMKPEYRKLELEVVFETANSETNQYHFKDDNHPYNYFKSVCDRLIKTSGKFQKSNTKPNASDYLEISNRAISEINQEE